MYNHVDKRSGLKAPLIADDVYVIIQEVCAVLLYATVVNLASTMRRLRSSHACPQFGCRISTDSTVR